MKGYFEEDASLTCTILRTLLHVVDKRLSREEYTAKLALHRDCMFEDALIYFDRVYFRGQMPISVFNIGDGFT